MGRIKVSSARKELCWYFRMGKENWNSILCEMKKEGYINYNIQNGIEIQLELKDLV